MSPLPFLLPKLLINFTYRVNTTLRHSQCSQTPSTTTTTKKLGLRGLEYGLLSLAVAHKASKPSIFLQQTTLSFIDIIMAALLPTILSDDDDEESSSIKGSGGRVVNKSKKKRKKSPVTDNVSDDDGSTADEMDGDFEFGGLLVRFL